MLIGRWSCCQDIDAAQAGDSGIAGSPGHIAGEGDVRVCRGDRQVRQTSAVAKERANKTVVDITQRADPIESVRPGESLVSVQQGDVERQSRIAESTRGNISGTERGQ